LRAAPVFHSVEYLALIGTALGSGFVVQVINMILNRRKRKYSDEQEQAKSELVWKEAHDALDDAFVEAQKKILLLQRGMMELELKIMQVEGTNQRLKNELDKYRNRDEPNAPHAGSA